MKFLLLLENRFKFSPKWMGLLLGIGVIAVVFLLTTEITHAAETASSATTEIEKNVTAMANIAFKFLNILLYPILVVVSALMDNEVLIGPEMESKLLEIWTTIRNWVNMIFVLLLVGVALYNVLGIAEDGSNYALKSLLPKMVIGLVAINFSFLAGKVLIDATAVATTAVYALPTNLVIWDKEKEEVELRLCTITAENKATGYQLKTINDRRVDQGTLAALLFCQKEATQDEKEDPEFFTGIFNSFGAQFFNNFGSHNVAAVMMVNMGLLSDANQVASGGEVQAISNLTFQVLFSVLMFAVFGFSYVALAAVLLARLIVLWICLALSPVVILLFVFPDIAQAGGSELDLKGQFFKHLFAPLIIGVVFSVGFTMLKVLEGSTSGSWMGALGEQEFSSLGNTEAVTNLVTAYGKDISNFQELLIAVAAVVIIWVGVFTAASQTIASSITDTIKGAGQEAGKFLASAPTYLPMIPIPGKKDGGTSIGSILSLPRALMSRFEDKKTEGTRKLMKHFGIEDNPGDDFRQNMMNELKGQRGTLRQAQTRLNEYFRTKGTLDNPKHVRDVLNSFADGYEKSANLNLKAKILAVDDTKLVNALKAGTLKTDIFGSTTVDPNEWGKDPIPSTPSAPAVKSPADELQGDLSQLGTQARLGGNQALMGKVDRFIQGSENNSAKEVFTQQSHSQLDAALSSFKSRTEGERSTVLQRVDVKGGQLDTDSFVQAVGATPTPAVPG
ncbi:MAG: hypothetical protein ACD_28C00288G0003, partial [uncultured bacterium]